jgi:hypothetical protein
MPHHAFAKILDTLAGNRETSRRVMSTEALKQR